MTLEQLIRPDSVLCNAQARSKKHCIEILSELLARKTPEIGSEQVFENLVKRERLGCTGLDKGVAFPHCRVDGLDTSIGAMILLSEPVDFDAPDGEPVDLVFGLMVPDEVDASHGESIRLVTSILADEGLRSRLRSAKSSSDLYEALIDGSTLAAPRCA
ncbi:MAG: PTS sugar transporter subunit IIA [Woeseiaceae bacterium]|nr:PTS sugar transporter subunit IIA [Woeseiaceae bacterium]